MIDNVMRIEENREGRRTVRDNSLNMLLLINILRCPSLRTCVRLSHSECPSPLFFLQVTL